MEAEDIIVINSGIRHQILAEDKNCLVCSLVIPRSLIAHTIEKELFLIWCNSVQDKTHDFTKLRELLKSLIRHCLVRKRADMFYQGKLFELLYELTEHYLVTGEDVRYQEQISKNEERIWQILSYIHENYNKEISLNELADKLFLTNAYLSRFFKRTFGVNFGEYLSTVKLHHAVEDLLYSTKSVTRIAMDNGFSNMGTFNKSFKAAYGMSPKAYKEVSGDRKEAADAPELKVLDFLEGVMDSGESPDGTASIPVTARVDVRLRRSYRRPWRMLINVGDIASLRDYRVRSELLRLNSSLKFSYARVWNILCTDMHLGRYVSDDVADYDFSYLDDGIDFLLQNDLKPFLQMGYKRVRYFHDKAGDPANIPVSEAFEFESLNEYLKVLTVTLRHLIVRYGQEEMNTWRFEIWHPNICYNIPEIFIKDGAEQVSSETYRIIRRMLPNGKIGGAEFTFLQEVERICGELEFYKAQGICFDFITCVSFPYKVIREGGRLKRMWLANHGFMKEELECLKAALHKVGWDEVPVWVTEYSFTVNHRNLLNDTRFKGAYILKNMSDISELAEAAGYWLLSDVYSEGGEPNRLIYGGSGIVTKDGINKPVYYALYFLSLLKPQLIARGENYLLTTDGNGVFSMILYNMKELNYLAFMKNEDDMTEDDMGRIFEDAAPVSLTLCLDDAEPGKYRMKRLLVDEKHGDIQAWVHTNYTGTGLKRSEIWHLQQTCMPEIRIFDQRVKAGSSLTIEEKIEANCFIYIEIERVH